MRAGSFLGRALGWLRRSYKVFALLVLVLTVAPTSPAQAANNELTISDVTVTEGNTGSLNASFTVTRSNVVSGTSTVSYATADGTATQPADYTNTSGTLTFTPGQTSKTVNVPVKGDTLDEANETFFVNLSGATNATITDSQGQGTITDNDPTPSLGINDVSVTEGNTGTTNATFTVSLSAASGKQITVNYATANNTASAPSDYTATSGTLTFAPGVTTQQVSVPVKGDTLDEVNETFFVNLTNPSNATISDSQGVGTITDDDGPTISINDVALTEGNTGSTTNANFTVSLSAPSPQQVTVAYATADNTASAPSDYTATSDTLTFAPGETSKTISVPVVGDTLDEADETFFVNLSGASNATIADSQGVSTINDDDAAPSLSIDDVNVTEGNTGTTNATFTVTLSAASGQAVTVDYGTADDTASAPDDYATTSGTLTFAPGETSKTITVPVVGDTLDEPNETFFVNLSGASNATISDDRGVGTINDDDDTPQANDDGSTANPIEVEEDSSGGVTTNVLSNDTGLGDTPVTVTIASEPAKGTATVNSGNTITYVPDVGETGADSYKYTVTDADGDASTATVYIEINPVNDNPTISSVTADPDSLNEGSSSTITVNATDPDSTILNYEFDCNGDGDYTDTRDVGPQSSNSAECTFADGDANGTDYTLSVRVTDGDGGEATDSTMVTVDNVAPVVNAGPDATISEGQTFSGDGSFTDPGTSDTFTATVDYGDGSGTQPLTLNPDKTFSLSHTYSGDGTYSVTVTVTDNDGDTGSDTLTVTVTVTPVNEAPVNTVPDAQTISEDAALVFSTANKVSISDEDAGSNPLKVTLSVTNGTLTLSGTSGLSFTTGDGTDDASMIFTGTMTNINSALDGLRFEPTANYNGSASLTISTNDQGNSGTGGAQTDTDTVSITVNAVNDTPTATSQSVTTDEDTSKAVTLSGSDVDGDSLSYTVVQDPAHGILTGTAPNLTYTPSATDLSVRV